MEFEANGYFYELRDKTNGKLIMKFGLRPMTSLYEFGHKKTLYEV